MLKSGAIFAFDISTFGFGYDEKGYFIGNGLLSPKGYSDGYFEVFDFTFHKDEVSCEWLK